jgi:hypothetical protein
MDFSRREARVLEQKTCCSFFIEEILKKGGDSEIKPVLMV